MSALVLVETAVVLGIAYAALGLSAVVVAEVTRTLHLAIGPLVVTGAAAMGVAVALGWGPVVGLVLALALTVVVSALLIVVLAPTSDLTARIVGLVAAGAVVEAALARAFGVAPRPVPPLVPLPPELAAVLVLLPVVVVLSWAVGATRWGRRLRLVGGSHAAAEVSGIDPVAVRVGALAVAGATAALVAAMIVPITPLAAGQGAGLTFRAVAAALVLGRRRPIDAVAGGAALGAVEALALGVFPGVPVAVVLVGVVLAVLVARPPEGDAGWARPW